MSELLAARAQMGTSLAFHIVFAVLGVGLPLLLCMGVYLVLTSLPSGRPRPDLGDRLRQLDVDERIRLAELARSPEGEEHRRIHAELFREIRALKGSQASESRLALLELARLIGQSDPFAPAPGRADDSRKADGRTGDGSRSPSPILSMRLPSISRPRASISFTTSSISSGPLMPVPISPRAAHMPSLSWSICAAVRNSSARCRAAKA